jgi:uncharacterized protein YeaO (DUF488 family)
MGTARKQRILPVRCTEIDPSGEYSSPACYQHEFERADALRGFDLKRIYDRPAGTDGFRVLVDRLWPRGMSKTRAHIDAWLKDLAPSNALRQWFHEDRERWREFSRRYRAQLRGERALLDQLRERARAGRVTLLYAAQDTQRNHALVLRNVLQGRRRRAP